MEAIALFVKSFWAPIAGVIAFIIWLVKLEASSKNNTKRIKDLEVKIDQQQKEASDSREKLYQELKEMRHEFNERFDQVNKNILDTVRQISDSRDNRK